MTRVCVVSALYHPTLGGLGRQAQLLTERLRREGVDLFVIARRMSGVPQASFSPDVEVVRISAPFPEEHILEEVTLKNIGISVSFSLGCLAALVRNRRRYDLVHFHGGSIPLFVSLPFLKLMGKKVLVKVASIQGTEAGSLSGKYGFMGGLLARLVRRVDAFVGISGEIRDGLARDGIPPERIHAITNFIDMEMFHPPGPGEKDRLKEKTGCAGRKVVVCSGRLAPIKGIDRLLEAWSAVSREFPDAVLLLLGEGPLRGELERRAAVLGISGTVRFEGRVGDVPDRLRAADLLVLSSLMEGLPNSVLEAMATGLPVVATRVGGVADVVTDGRNGILVDPADPAALAEGLRRLLADAGQRDRMGEDAFRAVRARFGLESIAKRYVLLYEEMTRA